jgi:hypothetical protein
MITSDDVMATSARHRLRYDRVRRRLWIGDQRCHHGATGALLTALAAAGLAARVAPRHALALVATGSALMVHDWHDRAVWFARGPQS